MDSRRWKLVERLYEEVRELSEEDRIAHLHAQHIEDPAVIEQVHALFAYQDKATDFFSSFHDSIFGNSGISGNVGVRKTPAAGKRQAPEKTDALVGQTLAQYQIQARLGSGGMGVVYKARDTKLERDVALKIISAEMNSNQEARERFLVEARAASALLHPNVATVYAIEDILGDRLAISMSYCEGCTLKDHLKQGLLPVEEVVAIALQLAKGLYAAHQKGVIHRDVKPGNVMISEEGMVRIVDFGLARFTGQSRITKTGSTLGTVAYMAPEQVRGEHINHQVDIWAFGVVLFEMLTGQVPFGAEHMHSMLYAIVNEPPTPLFGLRPGLPAQLDVIVKRALTKDLHRRYSDFQDIMVDLEAVQAGKELLLAATPSPADLVMAASVDKSEAPGGPVKILVVDDEPDIELLMRQQYMKKIRAGEWSLVFAENGQDALDKLAADHEIQVVLTDIQMPVMNGLTLLSRIDELDRLVRTIVVSAYGDMQNIRQAMNNGAYDFLTKPIQFPDLERTIYKTVENVRELEAIQSTRLRLVSLENELSLARKIQRQVLPRKWQESDELDVYAYLEPAHDVCGDFYDFFFLEDDRFGLFIGDVAGRGFSASMFMAMARTLLKADAQRGLSPAACMDALNKFLHPEEHDDIFITAFYGVLNIKSGELIFCNAGHNPPLVLRGDGSVEQVPWEGGIGIGIRKDFVYEDSRLALGKMDGLFLYTDGLLKTKNAHRELFTEQHLMDFLKTQQGATSSQVIRRTVRTLADFGSDTDQVDDRTMMAVKRTMAPPA